VAIYQANLRLARFADAAHRDALQAKAVKQLRKASEREPTRAEYHYLLADLLLETGDRVEGMREARRALTLDEEAPRPGRKLNEAQRERLRKALATAS
jgi:Flp pilus assembly protein TadD